MAFGGVKKAAPSTAINDDGEDLDKEDGDEKPVDGDEKPEDGEEKPEETEKFKTHDKFKRMDLIKMSNNNKYFLFYDNKETRFKVYNLKLAEKEND